MYQVLFLYCYLVCNVFFVRFYKSGFLLVQSKKTQVYKTVHQEYVYAHIDYNKTFYISDISPFYRSHKLFLHLYNHVVLKEKGM